MNIKESNRLIAEFMNWEARHEAFPFTMSSEFLDLLKYHSSWDWLMPVVEKIIKEYRTDFCLEFGMISSRETFEAFIGSDGSYRSDGDDITSPIKATYEAVIAFIEWKNQQE